MKEKKYLFINDKCYTWGFVFYSNLKAKFTFRSWTTAGANRSVEIFRISSNNLLIGLVRTTPKNLVWCLQKN